MAAFTVRPKHEDFVSELLFIFPEVCRLAKTGYTTTLIQNKIGNSKLTTQYFGI
jgi:hypothetical protein